MPEVDDFTYQLYVERTVWNIIKDNNLLHESIKKYSDNSDGLDNICFRLFCLFNRFCESNIVPMKIQKNALDYMYSKFGIMPPEDNIIVNFRNFLDNVCTRKDIF